MIPFIAGVFAGYIGYMAFRARRALRVIRHSAKNTQQFNYISRHPKHTFLVLGDSTMFGAGIVDPNNTMGGQLLGQFPGSSVQTLAVNGTRLENLPAQLNQAQDQHHSLMMVGVGGNDIVLLTSYDDIETHLRAFLKMASSRADAVVLMHCVNVGNIGFFLPPLDRLFDRRTRKLSQIYERVSTEFENVYYANFYRPRKDDFYTRKTRARFIASDGFHPSDYANRYFFKLIVDTFGVNESFLESHRKAQAEKNK